MTGWKRGGEPGGMGRGHLHNIPFIHRTKQTSTESLLRLEIGSMGEGEQVGSWGVVKKNTGPPPNWGAWGRGDWSASTQEESENQKQFGKARTVRGGRRKVQGVGDCLATG